IDVNGKYIANGKEGMEYLDKSVVHLVWQPHITSNEKFMLASIFHLDQIGGSSGRPGGD
uniref:Uncharacterized protein n=1 Tax=Urocitellus parryii TaxID=9999 RepID=A0A8D2GS49_UROPR